MSVIRILQCEEISLALYPPDMCGVSAMYRYEKSLVKKNHSSSWDSASGSFLIESPSVGWSVLVVDSSFADFELSSLSLVVVLLSLVCDSSFGDFSTFGFGFGILLTLETY